RAGDPDGRPKQLSFSTSGRPGWLSLNKRTGVMAGTPPKAAIGKRWAVTIKVTDGAATASRKFTVRVVRNKPPVLQRINNRSVGVDRQLTIKPKASDPDRGPKALRYSATGRPGWLKLNAKTGVLSGKPPRATAGRYYRLQLKVTDGAANASRKFNVVVFNARPAMPKIAPQTADVGDQFQYALNGFDADNAPKPLRYSAPRKPNFLSVNAKTGVVRGAIPAHAAGKTFKPIFRAFDGDRYIDRTLRLRVRQLADRPPVLDDASFAVDENAAVGTVVGSLTGTDPDGDSIEYTITAGND